MSYDNSLLNEDFYKVLGCSSDAKFDEIKEAYRRKVLESHPDKSEDGEKTVGIFRQVKEAWETLKDPELRKQYDLRCRHARLEAETALVHARLHPSELDETEDEDVLSYPCRCGNDYLVYKSDLEESNCVIHVPCQDCTFVIAIET